jgi:hypothetical protein
MDMVELEYSSDPDYPLFDTDDFMVARSHPMRLTATINDYRMTITGEVRTGTLYSNVEVPKTVSYE